MEDISKQEVGTNFQITHACWTELLWHSELVVRVTGQLFPLDSLHGQERHHGKTQEYHRTSGLENTFYTNAQPACTHK